ncbi:uncharacterized protein LOC143024863 isoform X2 [Oratosquilla oratoria]|uniref:uncharacterized protein LOC143024863 isoform X2 n=1 Tax=Oratosquilla oratoria TaxID=337810 RepID=UPI003F76DA96
MFPYSSCMCFKPERARRQLWVSLPQHPQRRQGVAIDRLPENGLLVTMLGDVKGGWTVDTSLVSGKCDSPGATSSSPTGTMPSQAHMGATFMEHTDVHGVLVPGGHTRLLWMRERTGLHGRFLTLHRRRRRKPPTRALHSNKALLDDLYSGPTQCVLSRVGIWGFNAFSLDSVCGGRPVSVLCVYLLHKYGLVQTFGLDTVTVWKCFSLIEDGYHANNPYHNAVHAADVTQAMHCYLQEERIRQHMTPIETLGALVAAVCHDLDHPGVNQPFLVATDNHLAALYENLSVLENHHWRCAMGCLLESGVLESWEPDQISKLQDSLRSLILATDITRQQEFLNKFKRYLDGATLDMTDPECRHFSLQIALKCADICNPCRPWEISRVWSSKICDEFYRQGDFERQLNIPVTSLCDRTITSVAKIQTGFIRHVVSPLFESWDQWLGTELSSSMMKNMKNNLVMWEEQLASEVAEEITLETNFCGDSLDDSAQEEVEEDEDEEDRDTPCSSADSHQSVLGSLENVSHSLMLGRRHSVPLNVPRLIPRTVICKESLPEVGGPPLVVETVVVGGSSTTSITSSYFPAASTSSNASLSADALLPQVSIAAMGDVGRLRPKPSTRLRRRMSLPPLWLPRVSRSLVSTVKPLSPTLSESNNSESCSPQEENKNFTSGNQGSAYKGHLQGGVCESGSSGSCGGNGQGGSGGGVSDSAGKDCLPKCKEADHCGPTFTIGGETQRDNVRMHRFLGGDLYSTNSISYKGLQNHKQVLVRRASLDSNHGEMLASMKQEGHKYPRLKDVHDKENRAPRDSIITSERTPLWKTRAWRSLNHEDSGTDLHDKLGLKPGIYKLNQSQGNYYHLMSRRGSAPLLRPEELLGGLRGGAEHPDHKYMATRRGSAPSHQLHQGRLKLGMVMGEGIGEGRSGATSIGPSSLLALAPSFQRRCSLPHPLNRTSSFSILEPYLASISGSESESGNETSESPVGPKDILQSREDIFSNSHLCIRRGSVPLDTHSCIDNTVEQQQSREDCDSMRRCRKESAGGIGFPTFVERTFPSIAGGSVLFGGSMVYGAEGMEGSVPFHWEGSHNLGRELPRVSHGTEMLSGFWRSQLDLGSAVPLQDESDNCSFGSCGGLSPSTGPGLSATLPPEAACSPFSTQRRGSLPSDLFHSGDLSVWNRIRP